MTPRSETGITWNKIFVVCGTFLVPAISVIIMATGWATEIKGKLDRQGVDIQDIKADLKGVHQQIDTISIRQHDAQLERNYQFKYLQQKK